MYIQGIRINVKGGIMQKTVIFICILMVYVFATPPVYNDFVYVYASGQAITVTGGHADPCVIDWDGDG